MQQYAVNSIVSRLADTHQGDILSVNGPPGTGKTTLLRYFLLPDSFIITPFNEISKELRNLLREPLVQEVKKGLEVSPEEMNKWITTHIGTVHTFQGKQADGVILCLGLDDKTKGAVAWAAQKPNLLNVALTRAKYRFVAVGDEKVWLKARYFKELRGL